MAMDTIMIIRDSVAMCVNKSSEICQPCVGRGVLGISWPEAFVLVFLLLAAVAITLLTMKYSMLKAKAVAGNEKSGETKGEGSKEKQLAHLQELLLKHLQTRVYIEKIDKEGHKYKEYNEANDKDYTEILKSAINELKSKK